jgi:hypothetical protein
MAPSSGEVFPDLVLCDHAGNEHSFSDLVPGDPTVVQTYRGWWCSKEQAFLRKLVALQDEMGGLLFDDLAVQHARRAVLAALPLDGVTTLLSDAAPRPRTA